MLNQELLTETLETAKNVGSVSGRRHPSGDLGCVSIQRGCRSERRLLSACSVSIALTERSFSGYIEYQIASTTRRRRSRQGSRLTRPLSRSTASGIGCTLLWTPSQNCCLKLTCSAVAGLTPLRRSCIGLREKHDLSDAVFLVDGYGYQTALSRVGLSGRLDYRCGTSSKNGSTL